MNRFLEPEILGSPTIDPSTLEQMIVIQDDFACAIILKKAGIQLPPENPPFTKNILRFQLDFPGESFHALCFHEYGHSNPADNGLSITLIPTTIDAQSAEAVFKIICGATEAKAPELAAA